MFDTLLTAIEPHLTEILTGILIWLFGLFVMAIRSLGRLVTEMIGHHLGLQAQRIWRETLHRALQSGVLATSHVADQEERIDDILRYAWRSSPDALRSLAPDGQVLRDLARAKLREVEGAAGEVAR